MESTTAGVENEGPTLGEEKHDERARGGRERSRGTACGEAHAPQRQRAADVAAAVPREPARESRGEADVLGAERRLRFGGSVAVVASVVVVAVVVVVVVVERDVEVLPVHAPPVRPVRVGVGAVRVRVGVARRARVDRARRGEDRVLVG